MKLTVICWLWSNGWRRGVYTTAHVRRMKAMVAQHLKTPHNFVCITDQIIPGVDTFPLPCIPWLQHQPGIPCGYYKLWAFSRAASCLGDKLVSIDLDAIIRADITDLLSDDDFKVMAGTSCPYNTSIFQIAPGVLPQAWDSLTMQSARQANQQVAENGRRFHGSDQAFAAFRLPGHPVWTRDDGLYQFAQIHGTMPDNCRILFFAGRTKPWDSRLASEYWG